MPTYDYHCDHCGAVTEIQLTVAERDSAEGTICSECDVGRLSRHITCPGFSYDVYGVLKRAGDGFKEVQQKIIASPSVGKGHTIRTK